MFVLAFHHYIMQTQDRGVELTCSIWQRSEVQSMFSQGWYMPSVTQLRRITMMLILSNHVATGSRLRSAQWRQLKVTKWNVSLMGMRTGNRLTRWGGEVSY